MRERYKVGDITSGGDTISHIFGCKDNEIVFENSEGKLRWETTCEQGIYSKAVNKFNYLYGKIPSDIPKNINDSIINDLAFALHHSFCGDSIDNVDSFFEGIEKRVLSVLSPNQAKLWLVLYSLISSITLVLILFTTYNTVEFNHRDVLLCGGAGVLGGALSLMQRNTNISINLEDGKSYIFLQAAFVPVLAMLSGFCLYLLSYSDLALGFAKDNIFNLLTLSIISGVSERFVPDLFKNATKSF